MVIILAEDEKLVLIKLISLCLSNNFTKDVFNKSELELLEWLRDNMEQSNER